MKPILLLVVFASLFTDAQLMHSPVGSLFSGATAHASKLVDPFSSVDNPAALAAMTRFSGGLSGERRFSLNELSEYEMAINVPASPGVFGFIGKYFGFAAYHEAQYSLQYARNLSRLLNNAGSAAGNSIDIGVRFNYYSVSIPAYGSLRAINFDIGVNLHLGDLVNAGFRIYNPLRSILDHRNGERLPSIYEAGLGYEPSDRVYIGCNVKNEEGSNGPVFRMDIEYLPATSVRIRMGMSTSAEPAYLALGYSFNSVALDAVAAYHRQLGVSPGLMLSFSKKEERIK
ncbi:MAG TPA: hypothetical protein VGC95_01230 [Chitinophagaceae bacterium]